MATSTSPAPTLALLVRHGQTPTTGATLPGRAPGLHLADTGRAQAEAVAQRLAALTTIDAVYASPLERTRETAAPIGRALGKRVRVHRGLVECDFGQWTGKKLSDLRRRKEWATVQRYPSGFRFPGGESFPEMQQRTVTALADLVARHPGRVLTHRQLLKEIWGPNAVEHVHYLRVHMASLRRKVEAAPARPAWLVTEPGVGYRLRDALA